MNTREAARRVAAFVAACRRRGIKATHQRLEILRALARTDGHPDAAALYRQVRRRLPALSLDTVYRTLNLLEANGIVARVGAGRPASRFDANPERHHHFVCTACGRMVDFTSTAWDGLPVPPEAAALGRVDGVQVQVRGRCWKCQARRPQTPAPRGGQP